MSLPTQNSPRPDVSFDFYSQFIEQGGLFMPNIPEDELASIGMWRAQNVGQVAINLMLNRFILNPFYEAHVTDDRDYAETLARSEASIPKPYAIPEDERSINWVERHMATELGKEYSKGMMVAGIVAKGYERLPRSTQGDAFGRVYPKGTLMIHSLDSSSREFIKRLLPDEAHKM